MPFKPPTVAKCPKCNTSVYAAEEMLAAGHKFHKKCFKCDMCNKFLESTNVSERESKLYCKQCYGRKFGPKGYGFGGGAGALGMDKGERFGNKECEMDTKPKGDGFSSQGSGTSTSTGPKCPRCGKTVYDAERAIGVATPWHKSCFNCKDCHKTVDSTTMAAEKEEIYCKGCHSKNFGRAGLVF